jgi:hypothetical protein
MERIIYVTIERNEDFKTAITKMKTYLGPLSEYIVYDKPEGLMGSAKILKLRKQSSISRIAAKVDGPGFIIDEIYQHFTSRENEHSTY